MAEPLFPSSKPCRFLYDIMVESEITGIPVGVSQRCALLGAELMNWEDIINFNKELDKAFLELAHMIGQSYESDVRPSLTTIEHFFAHIRGCLDREREALYSHLNRLRTEERDGLKRRENGGT